MSTHGHPGEPGEPGVGGHGGHGGHGGAGGTVHYRGLIVFVMIVTVVLSVGTLILLKRVNDNTVRIATVERLDVQALRAADVARDAVATALTKANQQQNTAIRLIREAEYRICVRQQVVRVAINQDRYHDEPALPLYDCTPNLTGFPARRLTASQAEKFVVRVYRDGFTP